MSAPLKYGPVCGIFSSASSSSPPFASKTPASISPIRAGIGVGPLELRFHRQSRLMRELPAIHVRNGRINFKFGNDKIRLLSHRSRFRYLSAGAIGRGWEVDCFRQARAHRPARHRPRRVHAQRPLVRRAGTRRSEPGHHRYRPRRADRAYSRRARRHPRRRYFAAPSGRTRKRYRHPRPPEYRRRSPLGSAALQGQRISARHSRPARSVKQ